jgi:CHRD domain-containing protein
MFSRFAAGFGIALALAAGPALARELTFTAALGGDLAPTITGSKATGHAVIRLDTDKQTVDVKLAVRGLSVDQLSNGLRGTPMGPIHLHIYGTHVHSKDADAALVFPLPYGPSYAPTADGFTVETGAVTYAKGAGLVNTKATFAEFVHAMQGELIVLNVHTNRFGDGEISGDVLAAG